MKNPVVFFCSLQNCHVMTIFLWLFLCYQRLVSRLHLQNLSRELRFWGTSPVFSQALYSVQCLYCDILYCFVRPGNRSRAISCVSVHFIKGALDEKKLSMSLPINGTDYHISPSLPHTHTHTHIPPKWSLVAYTKCSKRIYRKCSSEAMLSHII